MPPQPNAPIAVNATNSFASLFAIDRRSVDLDGL